MGDYLSQVVHDKIVLDGCYVNVRSRFVNYFDVCL